MGFAFVEAFARHRLMLDIHGQHFELGSDFLPIIKRCLQCRRYIVRRAVAGEVFRYDDALTVAGSIIKCGEFHEDLSGLSG